MHAYSSIYLSKHSRGNFESGKCLEWRLLTLIVCFSIAEGSEDEIEVTSETDQMNNSTEELHTYTNNNFQSPKEMVSETIQISVKSDLYDTTNSKAVIPIKYNSFMKNDDYSKESYRRAREIVHAILPSEVELKESGIFARTTISKGTRYGPFLGKWAEVPYDSLFAWEVRFCLYIFSSSFYALLFCVDVFASILIFNSSILSYLSTKK